MNPNLQPLLEPQPYFPNSKPYSFLIIFLSGTISLQEYFDLVSNNKKNIRYAINYICTKVCH